MIAPEQPHEYYELLGTVLPSLRERSFSSFDELEAEEIIRTNSTEPLYREPIILIDPGVESEPIDTITEAVKLIVPKVVSYAERRNQSVQELVANGHILGIMGIHLHNYTGIGFALWRPTLKDASKITWNSEII